MKKFQVLTDSTSDLVGSLRKEYDLDYVKMGFTLKGTNYEADLDWKGISPDDYYISMREGNRSITTLVQTGEFENKFTEYLDKGLDILYISCSSKLSGSINNGKLVANEILEKYPDRKILFIDSLRSNMGQGLMAINACKLANEGLEIEEVVQRIEAEKLNYQTYATVRSLEWLKKAGRVKASAAFFGNIFGVKPIILSDAKGNNYAFKKVKGRKTSLDELVSIVKENSIENETNVVYVEHANCIKDAEYVKEQILNNTSIKEVYISDIGPIIGATTGPDTITINFYGKKVTIVGEE